MTAAPSGRLSPELCLQIYDLMLRTRILEDRLITMYKQGEGFFWIGGPGEEALSVPLGLLIDKGQGVDHDYLHPHYRQTGTLLAMGADPVDSIRQMRNDTRTAHVPMLILTARTESWNAREARHV